ncbi:MAG: hypothetical protein FJ315_04750, partial [SAR202 cluster bacterium]|nr:hypothetical protein [SAR202 cluster bacterium]
HQLFRNLGQPAEAPADFPTQFEEVTEAAGPPFRTPQVSRGAAWGDYDGDGDLDILINNNGGACELLRNEIGNHKHWLQVRLQGKKSNRNGIGAELQVRAGGRLQTDWVRSGSSYCSASALSPHFGLGDAGSFEWVEVAWPSGRRERFPGGPADQVVTLVEGSGRPAPRR